MKYPHQCGPRSTKNYIWLINKIAEGRYLPLSGKFTVPVLGNGTFEPPSQETSSLSCSLIICISTLDAASGNGSYRYLHTNNITLLMWISTKCAPFEVATSNWCRGAQEEVGRRIQTRKTIVTWSSIYWHVDGDSGVGQTTMSRFFTYDKNNRDRKK